jgi:hypothetical protein
MSSQLDAFGAVNFNWTRQLKSVWKDPPYHFSSFNKQPADDLVNYLFLRATGPDPDDEPLGRVIVGPKGFGKTHLIGELRRQVWERDGWFVLLDFIGIKDFWSSVALGFLNSLQIRMPNGDTQCNRLVLRVAESLGIKEKLTPSAERWRTQSRDLMIELVRFFTRSLARKYPMEANQHLDAATALVLLGSENPDCQNIAHGWLQGMTCADSEGREFGFGQENSPLKVVRGLSWIMSRVAPTMIAVDQIDAIVTAAKSAARAASNGAAQEQEQAQSIVDGLAQGLMDLHESKRRAVTVVACLEATWKVLEDTTSIPMEDRYKPPLSLRALNSVDTARALIAARLQSVYALQKFVPPSPTWPFSDAAFESAIGLSPRELLKQCDRHQRECVAAGEVTLCGSFEGRAPKESGVPATADLEQQFKKALDCAEIISISDVNGEDRFRELIDIALRLLEKHYDLPDDIDCEVQRDPDQKNPSLHGRLSFTFLNEANREQHYCFRLIGHTNARAFQTRLRAAMTAAGIDVALKFRHLFILRRDGLPGGATTLRLVDQFKRVGGKFIAPTEDDLRVFVTLATMENQNIPEFAAWLRHDKPLFRTTLFKEAGLCPPPFLAPQSPATPFQSASPPQNGPTPDRAQPVQSQSPADAGLRRPEAPPLLTPRNGSLSADRLIPIGRRYERGGAGDPVALAADMLPRHIAVLAGPGSGKTVLLRRIVEEAVLLGIPSIVLDCNNDLSRLDDVWPTRPQSWSGADAAKADSYHAAADVMIWTPGVSSGNPISLSLLPDFACIENEDEREQAIEMARATLTPLLSGSGEKANRKKGVLAEAIRRFAAERGGTLVHLIALLAELPDDVSQDSNAQKLAREIADQLRAAIATNPLLKAVGEPLDPKTLFRSVNGKTRVSVINLSGLADGDARDSFVNRLQMALFTFIKKSPNPSGCLYVMDEAQNFAPAGAVTACKASALSLAAQARKFGLGMLFATQTPKGVDNKIISNCTTHLYGRMNAPATIDAIRDLMAAKGGGGDDIGKLSKGEFYFSTEGSQRPSKVLTPLCLSWHPANPPTADEVIRKASRKRG